MSFLFPFLQFSEVVFIMGLLTLLVALVVAMARSAKVDPKMAYLIELARCLPQ